MRTLLGAAAALGLFAAFPAHAVPSFCTGTITTVASGGFVDGDVLVNVGPGTSTGNCVQASDKFFGNFTVSGAITGGGSAGWLFTSATGPADVTVGFQGLVGSNSTGSVNYQVEIDPLTSNGAQISALEKDFTLNTTGAGSTATLTGNIIPAGVTFTGGDTGNSFKCTRTASASTCPVTGTFDPVVNAITVNESITTGPNTNVTAITDTVFQVVASVPEPSSLAALGSGLLLLGMVGRIRRKS